MEPTSDKPACENDAFRDGLGALAALLIKRDGPGSRARDSEALDREIRASMDAIVAAYQATSLTDADVASAATDALWCEEKYVVPVLEEVCGLDRETARCVMIDASHYAAYWRTILPHLLGWDEEQVERFVHAQTYGGWLYHELPEMAFVRLMVPESERDRIGYGKHDINPGRAAGRLAPIGFDRWATDPDFDAEGAALGMRLNFADYLESTRPRARR